MKDEGFNVVGCAAAFLILFLGGAMLGLAVLILQLLRLIDTAPR